MIQTCSKLGVVAVIVALATAASAQPPAGKPLFDGKSLTGWKSTNFGGEGEVTVEKGAIRIESGSPMTGITTTRTDLPRMNYEVSLEAKKIAGNDFFCTTTFPVGDAYCSLVVGGWGGAVVGISSLDERDASENETTALKEFQRDRWYKVRIRVTPGRLQAWIDDKQIVDVKTKDKKISVRAECEPCRPFGIATYNTTALIRDIRVRTLGERE